MREPKEGMVVETLQPVQDTTPKNEGKTETSVRGGRERTQRVERGREGDSRVNITGLPGIHIYTDGWSSFGSNNNEKRFGMGH